MNSVDTDDTFKVLILLFCLNYVLFSFLPHSLIKSTSSVCSEQRIYSKIARISLGANIQEKKKIIGLIIYTSDDPWL